MTELKIAAPYIRVSTDEQAELSPDSQLSVIRDYAEKNGYLIPDEFIFVDEGISGRSASNRPAFNRMIATARQPEHPFDCILVWKFSRFARNQEESIVYKAMLAKDKVNVVSVSEPLVEGPFGSLIERILEWMDEYYSIRLSGEVKRSMTLNAQRGRRQIAPPFGYMLAPPDAAGARAMVPEPSEAPLVQEIYRRFLAGDGMITIAKWLNSIGARTHRGGAMENRTVEYILRNPVYAGKLRWTPTGRTRRDFSNPDTIVTEGTHEAIVDEDIWRRAQDRMAAVKAQWGYKSRPSYELKDWLGGVVRCAKCGGTLVFVKPHYFKCNNYIRGQCGASQHIIVERLHEALLEKLREDAVGAASLPYQLSAPSDSGGDELARLRATLETLDRKLVRIRDSYAAGIDTLEEYRSFRAGVEAERKTVLERVDRLETRLDPALAAREIRKNLRAALKTLESPKTTKEQKNNAVRSIVHSCSFDKSTLHLKIVYRVSV